MTQLNRNNFLRWYGSFNNLPPNNMANGESADVTLSQASINISILSNDTSSYGIDPKTIEILQQPNASNPAVWDAKNLVLVFYTSGLNADTYNVTYRWQDVKGNFSNIGTVTVNIGARPTAWRGRQNTFECLADNSGWGYYNVIEQYYTDDESALNPPITKENAKNCTIRGYLTEVDGPNHIDLNAKYVDLDYGDINPLTSTGSMSRIYGSGRRMYVVLYNEQSGPAGSTMTIIFKKNNNIVFAKSILAIAGNQVSYSFNTDENATYEYTVTGDVNGSYVSEVNIPDQHTEPDADRVAPAPADACIVYTQYTTFSLSNSDSVPNACSLAQSQPKTNYYGFPNTQIQPGTALFIDKGLTIPVANGYYSDGTYGFYCNGGTIDNYYQSCPNQV